MRGDKNFIEILKNSLSAFLIRVCGIVLSYFFIFLISRGYGAEVLGIYSLSLTLLQIFSVLGKSGIDTALMKFVSEFSSQGNWKAVYKITNMGMKIVLPFSILVSLLVFLFSYQIAENVFNKVYLAKYFRIISLGIVPNILLIVNSQKIRGLKEIRKFSFIRNMSIPIFASAILGISMMLGRKETFPIIAYLSAVLLTAILSSYLWSNLLKKKENSPGIEVEKKHEKVNYRMLLRLSIPMLLMNSMVLIMGWTDTIMLGIFRTTSEVGYYRVPLRLAAITSTALLAINAILGPKIAELWKQKKNVEFQKIVQQSTMMIFWSSLPLILLLGFFRSGVLGIFGPDFKTGSVALVLLLIGQFFNSVVGSTGLILLMTGRQFLLQYIVIFGTIINLVLNFFLIPRYGIPGAAFASMLSMIFINLVPFFLIKNIMDFIHFRKRCFL